VCQGWVRWSLTIDGIVALIMALSRAIKPGDSVVLGADYELRLL